VCSRVSLQVEGVVESLAAECAEVALHVAVTFHVAIQQAQQAEGFLTHPAVQILLEYILKFDYQAHYNCNPSPLPDNSVPAEVNSCLQCDRPNF
jgi:hypothetical protein